MNLMFDRFLYTTQKAHLIHSMFILFYLLTVVDTLQAFLCQGIILLICCYFQVSNLTWWPMLRDCIYYTFSIIALVLVIMDRVVHWSVIPTTLSLMWSQQTQNTVSFFWGTISELVRFEMIQTYIHVIF